jgi:heme exporter protein D
MQWNSAAEFFAMGGYALYVWGSMGATALIVCIEILVARQRTAAAHESVRDAQMEKTDRD